MVNVVKAAREVEVYNQSHLTEEMKEVSRDHARGRRTID